MSLASKQHEVFTRSEMDLLQIFNETKNTDPINKDFFAKSEMEEPMASFIEMIDLLKTDVENIRLYSDLINIYYDYGVIKAEEHLEKFLKYSNLNYYDLIA